MYRVSKKIIFKLIFEFLSLGGVFLGVKNFGNKKFWGNGLKFFLFPKFLELFFTPKNTPPKVQNSKPFRITIFFGTPCRSKVF